MDAALSTGAASLFQRLPDLIFRPLASANRGRYWRLLSALYHRRFGPSAPLPPSEGFTRSELVRDIQDFLTYSDEWEAEEEGEELATPPDVRAQMVLNRLIDAGWLRVDRYGVNKRVSMAPTVSQFLTQLVDFAESEPVFLSGKIRSIEANIDAVLSGGHGDQFAEAAIQTRYLLEHVRNTGTNVRDVMDRLTPELTTRAFVRHFFGEFVTNIFIGDYRELRTTEHPLAKRREILDAVELIHENADLHARVLAWYRDQRSSGNEVRAQSLLSRDFERLRDLSRIDEYLQRLDREVTRATKRALAFLDYRIRSQRPLDALIERAIVATRYAGVECVGPFPPGALAGEQLLKLPRARVERPAISTLRRKPPSDAQIARARVIQRMHDARDLDPQRLAALIKQRSGESGQVLSSDLSPRNPFELFAYQRFIDIAQANASGSMRLRELARLDLPGFEVFWSDDAPDDGEVHQQLLASPPFVVRPRRRNGER